MVLDEKQAYIAYRCPACGQAVIGFVGKFSLSADMLKLKCPCHGSEMTMTYTQEKKIRITVPCLFCPNPHQFVVSQTLFFSRSLFCLNCPYSNMDICFIGGEEKVTEALDDNARKLNELYDRFAAASGRQEGDETEEEQTPPHLPTAEEALPDAQVYDVVRFYVRELQEDGVIHCPCQSGDYDFDFTPEGVRIYCRQCGAERVCPIGSAENAREFFNCDRLDLSLPGEEE